MKPPFAASIWVEGDFLYLELPSTKGNEKVHTVKFINSEPGLKQCLALLAARKPECGLASKGDPTQYQLDYDESKVRKVKIKETFSPQQRAATKEILRELGII